MICDAIVIECDMIRYELIRHTIGLSSLLYPCGSFRPWCQIHGTQRRQKNKVAKKS